MPNCDFYVLGEDVRTVLGFVFSNPGWLLVELTSAPDRELRDFRTEAELLDAYPTLVTQTRALNLQLWSNSMGNGIVRRRIDFRQGAVPGASFRYDSEGWGLIQLYFGGASDGRLFPSHTNHNSARRAAAWEATGLERLGPVSAWNWDEIARISRRLNRFIHAAAKAMEGSRPVLPVAHEARAEGRVALALNRG